MLVLENRGRFKFIYINIYIYIYIYIYITTQKISLEVIDWVKVNPTWVVNVFIIVIIIYFILLVIMVILYINTYMLVELV